MGLFFVACRWPAPVPTMRRMSHLILVGNAKSGTISAIGLTEESFSETVNSKVGVGCSTFAISRDGRTVHVAVKDPDPAIVTLELDGETRRLRELGRREVDDALAYVALTPDESTVLVASYDGGWGAAHPLSDRLPQPATSRIEYRNLHAVVPSADGAHAYFASLGDDLIAPVRMTAEGFEPMPTVDCPAGSGPRHLVLSEDQESLYLLTEFTGEAVRFARDAGTGQLTQQESVPGHDTTRGLATSEYGADPRANHLIWGADLHLAGRGQWLLCTERTESTLTAIAVSDEGVLGEQVGITGTEEQPRGFAVSPDGHLVVVVGERSGHATLYRLTDDGGLREQDRIATGEGPNWVRFVPA